MQNITMKMNPKIKMSIFGAMTLITLLSLISVQVFAVEEPKYKILTKEKKFELRSYDPMIIAEVEVNGSLKSASNSGFKLIADFIFGNNTAPGGGYEKIDMTAPVTVSGQKTPEPAPSEKIAMTAPVVMSQNETRPKMQNTKSWNMHFVMPNTYTFDTLPKPNNPAVKVKALGETKYAVLKFSGFSGAKKVDRLTQELLQWMKQKQITPKGQAAIARYNPPIVPPFMRRNEIMIAY